MSLDILDNGGRVLCGACFRSMPSADYGPHTAVCPGPAEPLPRQVRGLCSTCYRPLAGYELEGAVHRCARCRLPGGVRA